jgi:hypothetical protein
MHGGSRSCTGRRLLPQSAMPGARAQGPARKTPDSSPAAGIFSLTYLMEYDLMSNDQLFGNSLPPPPSGIRS